MKQHLVLSRNIGNHFTFNTSNLITREKLNQNCKNQDIFNENRKVIKVFSYTAELKDL